MLDFHYRSAIPPAEHRILPVDTDFVSGATSVPDEEWIKTLKDGRKVKFTCQELAEDGAFITAQIEGNKVVYSIVLARTGNPLSRQSVECQFEGELSKK